jgi:uncharacterized metal-binding protein
MPSGRTHDAITLLLAAPAFAAAYAATGSIQAAAVVAVAFVFGGIMFGPDLDTVSRQYSRWGPFRFIWFPYRSFFKHRSRFSHGLIFGSLIRVIYFMGILTLLLFTGAYAYSALSGIASARLLDLAKVWQPVGSYISQTFGDHFLLFVFLGLWLGAASHTFTDMAGSFVKTGRVTEFL